MAKTPLAIWTELQALSLRFRREDHARAFILRRMWLVVPLGTVFFVASAGCALGVAKFVMAIFPGRPLAGWHLWSVALLTGLTFFGAAVTQVYVLLSWLERACCPAGNGAEAAHSRHDRPLDSEAAQHRSVRRDSDLPGGAPGDARLGIPRRPPRCSARARLSACCFT